MRIKSAHAGLLLICALALLAGCNGRGQPTFRFGSLPFPGLALFNRADPDRLGNHRYWSPYRPADGEVGRGIIYTHKAGFLDVAHIRDAADWARYYAMNIQAALQQRQDALELGGPDRTRAHMRFTYPDGWDELPTFEREELIHELALRCGQESSYAMTTWHEVMTWYGHATVPPFSESRSSFTYDDVMSHVVGMYVVERAWSDQENDYDAATTLALSQVLHELEPATPEETAEVLEAVRGWWWRRGMALKRHLDVGIDDGEVTPMLAHAAQPAEARLEAATASPAKQPIRFRLPRLSDVEAEGLDLGGFFHLELEPRSRVFAKVRRQLPGQPDRIVPQRDIPAAIANVRREMQQQIGPTVDSLQDPPPAFFSARQRLTRG